MIWQDAFLEIPALLVLPLSHEIADHLIILKRYSHPEILLSLPCGGEAAVLADWSSCRLKECAGRSAEMYGSGGTYSDTGSDGLILVGAPENGV